MTSDERQLIQAAMQRLLRGKPLRSSGALNIVTLVAEAGEPIKRHHLTHKHTDLRDEFYAEIRAKGFVPESEQKLRRRVKELEARTGELRSENAKLHTQNEVLLRYNHALVLEREQLLASLSERGNSRVTAIRRTK